jgi:hypothetical protein
MKKIQFGMQTDQGVVAINGYSLDEIPWAALVVHSAEDGWRVSEVSTGGAVTRGHKLRSDAVTEAVAKVTATGEIEFGKKLAAFKAEHAPKPAQVTTPPPPPQKQAARKWPTVGQIVRIIYNRKKYPDMPLHLRHAKVLLIASSRPKNALCMLRGGKTVVIPIGNLAV